MKNFNPKMQETIKILLIEDNPGDARLVDLQLKEAFGKGYALETCGYLSKGLELAKGVELLSQNAYDVIILDLSLPDSSGLESFRTLFEKSPGCPIIILTGLEDEKTGIEAVRLGAQDFLIKGKSSSHSLRRSINHSIGRYKLLKQLSESKKTVEQKSADLLNEKSKLAQAQQLAHIGSWDWNILTHAISWSDELYRIYGLKSDEFSATFGSADVFTHPEDRERVHQIAHAAYEKKNPFSIEYRIVRSDGVVRTLYEKADVIRDIEGRAAMMFGTVHDVTEIKTRQALEDLAFAAAKSFNPVVITDCEGKIEWVNEAFTRINGYTIGEIKNSTMDFLTAEKNADSTWKKELHATVIRNKKPFSYEKKSITKDGRDYWVITTLTPVIGKNGEVDKIIAIDSDITKIKQMEEDLMRANKIAEHSLMKGNKALNELAKAKQQLESLLRLKEQFLANMSHEIRTPMNAIIGFTELTLKTSLSEDQKQYIEAIKTAGENLIVIINDILDLSKIHSGKIAFEKINFSISAVVKSAVEFLLPKTTDKNIKLSYGIDKRIHDRLIGDPTRLNQILLNLADNSIKFTESGEVKIAVSLISETNDETEIKFTVKDTGIGIPENKLDSIFEEFSQADNATTRKYGGSGLGLSIVKQLVEAQNGKIDVESKERIGSTFSFTLRFAKNLSLQKETKTADGLQNNFSLIAGLKVLLVEDNALNQLLAKKVLTDWNWAVEIAENGTIAIDKLKKMDFDIVLMDIQMPEMDGYETTAYIRKKFSPPKRDVPIIAMTAHAMPSEDEKCRKLGMDGYISKPFNQKVLYTRILTAINESGNKTNNAA